MFKEKYLNYKYSIEESILFLNNILKYQYSVQPYLGNIESNYIERWEPINCYGIKPNMYEISDYSRIKNIHSNRILSQTINKIGYLSVGLQCIDGSRKIFYVHRLVAFTFIPKTEEDIFFGRDVVNHINTRKYDNRCINLEWVTYSENNRYKIMVNEGLSMNPLMKKVKNQSNWSNGSVTAGEHNGMCRISDEQVHIICKCREMGMSYRDCALQAGMDGNYNSRNIVSMICRGLKRKNISSNYNISRCYYPNKISS